MRTLLIDNHDSYTLSLLRGWSRWPEGVCARTSPQSTAYAPRFPRGRWAARRRTRSRRAAETSETAPVSDTRPRFTGA